MDRMTVSATLSQEILSFGKQVFAQTVWWRLQQHGLSARRQMFIIPWLYNIETNFFNGFVNKEPRAGIAFSLAFGRIWIHFTVLWWLRPCFAASWRTHVSSVHSALLHRFITCSDGFGCNWMQLSITCCLHSRHFKTLHFCRPKAYGYFLF